MSSPLEISKALSPNSIESADPGARSGSSGSGSSKTAGEGSERLVTPRKRRSSARLSLGKEGLDTTPKLSDSPIPVLPPPPKVTSTETPRKTPRRSIGSKLKQAKTGGVGKAKPKSKTSKLDAKSDRLEQQALEDATSGDTEPKSTETKTLPNLPTETLPETLPTETKTSAAPETTATETETNTETQE